VPIIVSAASAFTIDPRGSAPFEYNDHYYERRHINGEFTGDVISFEILKNLAHGESFNGLQGHLLRIDDCAELDALRAVERLYGFFGMIGAFRADDGAWQWRDGPGSSPLVESLPACIYIRPHDGLERPECSAAHKSLFWDRDGIFPQQPPSGIYEVFSRAWNYQSLGGNGCGFTPDIIIEYEGQDGPVPTKKETWGSVKQIYRD
jgi:hypothetical protein